MNTQERLLDIINFQYPGLEDAATFEKVGERNKAVHAIAEHFRNRKKPAYLFDRETARFISDASIIEDAEKTMDHYIFGYQFEGPIKWDFNPTLETSKDNEWTWSLWRHIYWQPLARAYAITGDERYVKEFATQLKSFYESCPAAAHIASEEEIKTPFPGQPWRNIETAIRIYTTWLPCMEIFRKSPNFDDELWSVFLSSVHDHATFLLGHYTNHCRSSNWLTMECGALLQMGVMFPEMKDAKLWREEGYRRVMYEILYSFDQDGVHMERTPIYHMVASLSFLQAVRLLQLNGYYVPSYAMARLEKSAEFLQKIMKPDFSTPMIGDADRNDLLTRRCDTSIYEGMNLTFFPDDLNEMRSYFRMMGELTGREDFRFLATGGKSGQAPSENDAFLSDAGIYAMRTGFAENSDYVLLQMVKLERGEKSSHSHNDTAHLEVMLGGEDIVIDCGRFIYNTSIWKDWRHYFTSAVAHNTLYVDDHVMGDFPGVGRVRGVRGIVHEFTSLPDKKIIDVSHNGYVYMEDPVFHRRQVVMLPGVGFVAVCDYISSLGKQDHDLRLYWNFARPTVVMDGKDVLYTTDRGVEYRLSCTAYDGELDCAWHGVLLTGSEDPKGGWASFGYPVRVPTSQFSFRKVGKANSIVITVIARTDNKAVVNCASNGGQIRFDGRTIVFSENGVSVK